MRLVHLERAEYEIELFGREQKECSPLYTQPYTSKRTQHIRVCCETGSKRMAVTPTSGTDSSVSTIEYVSTLPGRSCFGQDKKSDAFKILFQNNFHYCSLSEELILKRKKPRGKSKKMAVKIINHRKVDAD